MKALVYNKELKLDNNYPVPDLKENEVLIKTLMVGICNTDYEITKGYMGYQGVLGHEFVGIVEKTGSNVDKYLINKRVVGEINLACNNCEWCHKGLGRHCPNRSTLGIFKKDGCFSEYFTLPKENVIEISDNIDDETATFTEPLAAAYEILEQLHIRPDSKVALVGDGKLGLCISLVFSALNIDFIHIGKHEEKLNISKSNGVKTMLLSELKDCHKKSFDFVIEATGSTGGFELSSSLVKPRGTLVLKSTITAKEGLNLASIVVDEITVVGSRCGQFRPILRLLEQGKINVKPLISGIYSVDDFEKAFEENSKKNTLKILVRF
ncbi:MAG: alcohol dehydrogenase catalytic domain-containing protein [Candidatus Gastranaerophilales bacterium]|nr:alcohol dehydrogenase catalytic domain-containing protein [Candidatus Gastranaerophilales bacterium]